MAQTMVRKKITLGLMALGFLTFLSAGVYATDAEVENDFSLSQQETMDSNQEVFNQAPLSELEQDSPGLTQEDTDPEQDTTEQQNQDELMEADLQTVNPDQGPLEELSEANPNEDENQIDSDLNQDEMTEDTNY